MSLLDKTTIVLGGEEIVLDPANLDFNEVTLTKYFIHEYSWYNYFGQKLAQAEAYLQLKESEYDAALAERFIEAKESSKCSDKIAEAKASLSPEVIEAEKQMIAARLKVKQLQQHVRTWDKNHENAQSLGHILRKEMDKLNNDIRMSRSSDSRLDSSIDDIINSSSWGDNG